MPHPIQTREAASERATSHAHRSNGFDLIRVTAALLVLVGHSFALSRNVDPGFLDNSVSTIGVKMFFITSGFLVTKSWVADPSPLRFAMRRLLRIMPGLVGVVLLTALVLGTLLTTQPWFAYLGNRGTWFYLWNIALYPVYSLPGVFADNPYPIAVNGSLWSLPIEVLMYALLPFVIGFGRLGPRVLLPVIACAGSIAAIYYVRIVPGTLRVVIYGMDMASLLEVSCYFAIGAVWAVFGWQRFARPWTALLLLAVVAIAAPYLLPPGSRYALSELALMLVLPCVVISCGVQRLAWYDRAASFGDISYGLYLYGFPVQQTALALSHGQLGPVSALAITVPVTALFAVASWVLLERSSLALKPARRRAGDARAAWTVRLSTRLAD